MPKTKHYQSRIQQRGIKESTIKLAQELGQVYGDKFILMSIAVGNDEFIDLIIKGNPRWGGFQIAEGRGTFKENLGTWYIDTDECYFSNLPNSKEEQLSRFW